jgi:hypothetical protein
MSINPVWEKFQLATEALAGSGGIRERLESAYRDHLSGIREEDLPKAIRGDFHEFCCAVTRECPLRGEDAIRATVRKLSKVEAESYACAVVRMFSAMPRSTAALSRAKAPNKMAQVVPLYIAEATSSH